MNATLTDHHQKLIFDQFSDKPIVVEVGSGIGRVTEFLAGVCAMVYAIDTWEHIVGPDERTQQLDETPFETFCINCWDSRLKIIPVHAKSLVGLEFLKSKGVKPHAIYLDGSHQYQGLLDDITTANSLFPGVPIYGDDFMWQCGSDMPVYRAIAKAIADPGFTIYTYAGGLWKLSKQRVGAS